MIKVIELFAGIGSQIQALKNIGVPAEVVAISEIDKYCLDAYTKLHGETLNLGDITKIKVKDIPACDLMTYSFPCQDISVAGKQRGLEEGSGTRSSLLWDVERIVEATIPRYLLMENVKNLTGKMHLPSFMKWIEVLNGLGYTSSWAVLTAQNFDIPQNRERVFMVSELYGSDPFVFDMGTPTTKRIRDFMETDDNNIAPNMWMDDKPYILRETPSVSSTGLIHVGNIDIKSTESIKRVYSIDGTIPTLTTMTGGHRQPKILVDGKVRKLTPRECWRLMGFKDEQFDKVAHLSNAQLYKQAGNTIVVPCLENIFSKLFQR